MIVIDDDVWLCEDCTQGAVNDEYSGLSYYLNEEEANARMEEIKAGLNDLGPHLSSGNEEDEEFSTRQCDCCHEHLAGRRVHFVILGEEENEEKEPISINVPEGITLFQDDPSGW